MNDVDELMYSSDEDADDITEQLTLLGINEDDVLSDDDEMTAAPAGTEGATAEGTSPAPEAGTAKATAPDGTKPATPVVGDGAAAAPANVEGNLAQVAPVEQPPCVPVDLDRPLRNKREKCRNRAGANGAPLGKKTIAECAHSVCRQLTEKKYFLVCQIVACLGRNRTQRLVTRALQIHAGEGMMTKDGSRRRSRGGVFLTLVKDEVEPAELKAMYAADTRRKNIRKGRKPLLSLAVTELGAKGKAAGKNVEASKAEDGGKDEEDSIVRTKKKQRRVEPMEEGEAPAPTAVAAAAAAAADVKEVAAPAAQTVAIT